MWALMMRALMVNTIGEDYMLLAKAKGLPERRILFWYGVRNAIPPQVDAPGHCAGRRGIGRHSGGSYLCLPGPRIPALYVHCQQRLHGHPGDHAYPGRLCGSGCADH